MDLQDQVISCVCRSGCAHGEHPFFNKLVHPEGPVVSHSYTFNCSLVKVFYPNPWSDTLTIPTTI